MVRRFFALLAVTVLFLTSGCGLVALRSQAPLVRRPEIGFASQRGLRDHFAKHGHEFRAVSEAKYLELAQTLRDAKVGGNILEGVRSDGVRTRFDKKSGAFLAYNEDGTIRTMFKPNDGEAYYWRQLKR